MSNKIRSFFIHRHGGKAPAELKVGSLSWFLHFQLRRSDTSEWAAPPELNTGVFRMLPTGRFSEALPPLAATFRTDNNFPKLITS
ncbi:MAG: hypothetical protein AB8F95_17315 [Bacteroidia bacterium]